jgi:hypothetical protein
MRDAPRAAVGDAKAMANGGVERYRRRLHAAAERDPALALAFINVVAMIDRPQRLLHPAPVARVLAGSLRAPRRPAMTAPAHLERTS